MSDRIAIFIMRYNLPAIALLVAIEIACVIFIHDKTLIAVVSTATGGVIGNLLNERLTLIQYFFGSSKGSHEKQEVINKKVSENSNLPK